MAVGVEIAFGATKKSEVGGLLGREKDDQQNCLSICHQCRKGTSAKI